MGEKAEEAALRQIRYYLRTPLGDWTMRERIAAITSVLEAYHKSERFRAVPLEVYEYLMSRKSYGLAREWAEKWEL